MAVKTDVVLLADAGDVTVARRTAFYTYGKFEVILPEGREQQETDNRIEDGYIARAHDGDVGRFDFGFIRADATVNIDAGTSDLETQIDSAELRSEGDVFFEGDITPSGFNGFTPGVDYDTGDIVTVRRWGTSLALPVTSIEMEVSESGGTRASRVHVSGQLIHDAASRRRSNDDLRQQIAAEKRERLRQVGAVDKKATTAQNTADTAESKADTADGKAEQAKGGAVEVDESTSEALQAETENILNQIRAQQDELAKALSGAVNVIMATAAGTSFPGVNTRPSSEGYDWEFTIPDTRGALAKIEFWDMSTIPAVHTSTQIGVVDSEGQRIRTTNGMFVQVTWAKPTAIQRTINQLITDSFIPQQASWTTVQNLVASPNNDASQGYLAVRVVWSAANRGSTYGVRFLIDGEEKGRFLSSKIGPLSFVGDGERGQKTSVTNLQVPAGKNIIVQVYSTAGSSSARRVKSVELTGTWIETAA